MSLSVILWRVLTGVKFLRKSRPKYHRSSVQVCVERCFHSALSVQQSVRCSVGRSGMVGGVVYFIAIDIITFKTCLLLSACTFFHIYTFIQLTPYDSSKI